MFAEYKAGFVRRTIWDGAQELGEIQVPDNAAFFEADSFTTPLSKSDATEDPNPYYGRVIYTPGLVIDQPVTITRLDYTDFPFGATEATRWPSFVLVPQWNQRGQPQFGTFGDGAAVRQLNPNGGPCGSATTNDPARCVKVVWPLAWSAYDQQNSPLFPVAWHGSLLEGKQDKTGTLYRRNRSYDSQAGRFTQEDPIGLAGGVNLYGFAAGDPVNFADPFGLCVPLPDCLLAQAERLKVSLVNAAVDGLSAIGEFTGLSSLFRGARGSDEAGNELTGGQRTREILLGLAALVPSEGAGVAAGQLKVLKTSRLKRLGIDSEAVKESFVGPLGGMFNIARDRSGRVFLTPVRKGSAAIQETGLMFDELSTLFPRSR